MNGYLILAIIGLMFLAIYAYSYRTVILEDKKRKEIWEKKRHLEMAYNARRKERSEKRRQKLDRFIERSKEIQQELLELKNSKQIQAN
ncbi:hypothetical protein OS188_09550 [Xanthomarina sp. F1114]|uniref:hypothetical protein n=1 Tax=Xanthomarina sp. F1114 TaxID=2996019 RepID=UPI00225DD644|nr:hypothetical protein [Xanthomarina sp. F1114]MCX7548197.1 hypothetical protein [Xanthomarina sp. F1114]